MNKKKLKEILAEMRGEGSEQTGLSEKLSEFDPYKALSKHIVESVKDQVATLFESAGFRKKIEDLGTEIEGNILGLSSSIDEIREAINSDLWLTSDDIENLKEEFNTFFNKYSEGSDKRFISLEKSIQSFNLALEKKHKDILSIHENHNKRITEFGRSYDAITKSVDILKQVDHSPRFESYDVKFEDFEKQLGKLNKNLYEFGSQLQILSNGTLIGATGQLNFIGATVSANNQGGIDVTVNGSSGGNLTKQDVNGTIDGSNTAFTVALAFTSDSFISLNGQVLTQGVDYIVSGTNITYTSPPDASLSGTTHVLLCTI